MDGISRVQTMEEVFSRLALVDVPSTNRADTHPVNSGMMRLVCSHDMSHETEG
ncbi:hypothetical protein MGN01_33160 [Methylobacterium gnaphalii]|uniref:Uncharacterized protein n=1 Tax=Methylobacterium gnaphalii TaxID=1010610 RepID=A0A512JND8_9HYPH|nr:hypothetical protein MGN01_33160 [Methylobacterium gnaphalii]GLS49475.1 hypothetical protein GCM10007885_23240 [Methylobacterium gnaphalii]